MYDLNLLIFYVNSLRRTYVAKESFLFLMKLTFFQVVIQRVFPELIEDLSKRVNMILFIDVDHDAIYIHNHKNV